MALQKVTPFLWFDHQAAEAATFYVSLFKNSGIHGGPPTAGAMVVAFHLGQAEYLAFNGGPHFKFSEAISLSVNCDDQAEVDELWEKLSAGGSKAQCGWLKDKYGLSWQIVPSILPRLMSDPDVTKRKRVMNAMMSMTKLDIAKLQAAYDGRVTSQGV